MLDVSRSTGDNAFVKLSLIGTYLMVIIEFTPLLQQSFPLASVGLSAWAIGCLVLGCVTVRTLSRVSVDVILASFSGIVLLILSRMLGHSTGDWGGIANQAEFLLVFATFSLYLDCCSEKQLKRLVFWALIVATLNMLSNVILDSLYYQNEGLNASLYAMNNKVETQGTNVGGTSFAMVCLFLFAACVSLAFESRGRGVRFAFASIAFVDGYLMVALQQRATIVICIGFFCVLYTAMRRSDSSKNAAFIGVTAAVIAIVVLLITSPYLASLFSDTRMALRFDQLSSIGDSVNDEGSSRMSLAALSLSTFLSSPSNFLIGVGYDLVSNTAIGAYDSAIWSNALYYGVGYHTDLFDNAACFGVLGLAIVLSVLCNYYRLASKGLYTGAPHAFVVSVFAIFILLLLTNNAETLQVGLAVCVCSLIYQRNPTSAMTEAQQ